MGTTVNVYAGPLLECNPCGQSIERVRTGICPHCESAYCKSVIRALKIHDAKGEKKFCHICGTRLKDVTEKVQGEVDKYYVTEAIKEALYFPDDFEDENKQYLIPNVKRDGEPREFKLPIWGTCIREEIQPSQIAEEIVWFEKAFEQEIKRVIEIFGWGNVRIRWMILSWWA